MLSFTSFIFLITSIDLAVSDFSVVVVLRPYLRSNTLHGNRP